MNIKENLLEHKKLIVAGTIITVSTVAFVGLNFNKGDKTEAKAKAKVEDKIEADKIEEELNAQKTKNKSKSNNSSNELVPYNLNGRLGSLGGGYNSIPLDYSTPTLEPTVYEPIIDEPTLEPVEDEIIEETDTPTVSEPIVNEVVAPPVTPPTAPNEEKVEEGINEASKFDVTTATYKGRNIVKHLPNMTYDVINTDNNVIIKVTGNNIHIEFTRVNNNEFNCTKLVKDGQELTGMERDKVLNEIFEINEGDSNNHVVIPPEPTIPGPTIPDPSLNQPSDKPVEPEQPKDDKVETEGNVINPDNTGVTAPPVAPPPTQQEVEIG